MAHSIQVVGEKNEIFDDGDLLILLRMMTEEVEKNTGTYGRLKPFAARWKDDCDYYTLGAIEIDLDTLVEEPMAKSELLELLSVVEQRIGNFGDQIPAEILNKRWHVPTIYFGDCQTHYLVSAVEKIRTLVA